MSNRSIWSVRQRHEWLRTAGKGKRLKRRKRLRVGIEQALQRKAGKQADSDAPAAAPAQS
jgi:hypothetical protein